MIRASACNRLKIRRSTSSRPAGRRSFARVRQHARFQSNLQT
ncbi:hypothetical protein I552_5130 [Mycobacterium xenopi 3993]|nr:hypothetical protein I552_5130 [Mycobacterium xenopi 3993]